MRFLFLISTLFSRAVSIVGVQQLVRQMSGNSKAMKRMKRGGRGGFGGLGNLFGGGGGRPYGF